MTTHKYDRPKTILVIDDEPGIHRALELLLMPDFSIHTALSGMEGLHLASVISPDLILLDLVMPQMSGMEVLKRLTRAGDAIPVIIFTAYGSVDSAVQAIKLGAVDYIEKPFDGPKLKQIMMECLERRKSFQSLSSRQDIIGESPQIMKVWQVVEKYGPTDLPILLQGETGTGKELFAKAIHEISKRQQEPLVPFDCSIIPEALFESEIFGYKKGAFTGADAHKPGHIYLADKGTFFLDEISNLPLQYQAKLLRVIQERQYIPLGATTVETIDVRFISSSNINLEEAMQRGAFRSDLYYRISGVCIEIPPLREREGDIELLARYFIAKEAIQLDKPNLEISDVSMVMLLSYPWPGNVRQLKYAVGAAAASADRVVLPEHLPSNIQQGISVFLEGNGKVRFDLSINCDLTKPIDLKELEKKMTADFEDHFISEVRKRLSINQVELAEMLGIDSKTLREKIGRKTRIQK
ncbi:MAG: sigma-54 dependent transcriptional regulator [Candidatus Omnitrophota bacterium]